MLLPETSPRTAAMRPSPRSMMSQKSPPIVVVLYPDSVERTTMALLEDRGYTLTHRLDGWLDWGNGRIEILQRR